jgi:hypothetical protein
MMMSIMMMTVRKNSSTITQPSCILNQLRLITSSRDQQQSYG